MVGYFTVEACTSSAAFEIKLKDKKFDLARAEAALAGRAEIMANTSAVLIIKIKIHAVRIYATGRIMFKNATKKEAEKLGQELMSLLEKGGAIVEN